MAYAQEASNEAGAQSGVLSVEEITVTGSRIRRTTDFDTANPTTVVDASYLQNLGIVNVGDAVKQLPANLSNNTPTTTGNANFFIGSTIANLRGLNPFFGSRTLNLVNNRRFVPTNQGDGVDLNFIPSVMIDRVDIVTGGASAAYGSGAISGVQNVFLSRKLEGGKVQVDFAQTGESDGDDKHVGLAYGHSLFSDRAHFVVGYEYEDSDPVGCFRERDWCGEGNGFFQNTTPLGAPPGTPTPNPQFILGSNLRQNQISTTGVFFNTNKAATTTFQGNAAGTGTCGLQSRAAALRWWPGHERRAGRRWPFHLQYTNLRSPVKRNVAAGTFTFEHQGQHEPQRRPVVRQGGNHQHHGRARTRQASASTGRQRVHRRQSRRCKPLRLPCESGLPARHWASARSTRTGRARSTRARTSPPR